MESIVVPPKWRLQWILRMECGYSYNNHVASIQSWLQSAEADQENTHMEKAQLAKYLPFRRPRLHLSISTFHHKMGEGNHLSQQIHLSCGWPPCPILIMKTENACHEWSDDPYFFFFLIFPFTHGFLSTGPLLKSPRCSRELWPNPPHSGCCVSLEPIPVQVQFEICHWPESLGSKLDVLLRRWALDQREREGWGWQLSKDSITDISVEAESHRDRPSNGSS